eukprot:TRINITY_DN26132_c0_g1_i1.p1 TRINITY_DN26132_c0_g1~~TRINITY_DN26132_c0_g1_i1.p1  ORF type:complete len:152 (-),score=16.53 TRINITY_DN26132_c0_g1_i1:50-505(-)
MASQTIETHRQNAEIHLGDALCKKKIIEWLTELSLPKGLLPLQDIVEVGYNRSTGFMWLRQKKKRQHTFRSIGQTASYDTEVTSFVESRRIKKITGVKVRELLIWISITEMYMEDPSTGKMTFKTSAGIGRTFPASAFELEEEKKENGGKK